MNLCKKKTWFWLSGVVLLLLMAIPYKSIVIPEWKIRVVSEDGKPLTNVPVTQIWSHKALELYTEHEEVLYSDTNGYVIFPERTIKSALVRRSWGIVIQALSVINPHAVTEPFSAVSAKRNAVFLIYREGLKLEPELVIKN